MSFTDIGELQDIINIELLERFSRGTIVPATITLNTLAQIVNILSNEKVATQEGADGLRYYNDKLQYAVEGYSAVIPSGNENPYSSGWYELSGTSYVLTTDTAVVSGKTYYALTVTWTDIEIPKVKATYDESPALCAHSVDDIIYFDNHLYKVISSIAVGDTITDTGINANITSNTGIDEDTAVYIENLPDNDSSGGSGHKIVNSSDVELTNRTKLKFDTGFNVTDDSTNDKTIVELSDTVTKVNISSCTTFNQIYNLLKSNNTYGEAEVGTLDHSDSIVSLFSPLPININYARITVRVIDARTMIAIFRDSISYRVYQCYIYSPDRLDFKRSQWVEIVF